MNILQQKKAGNVSLDAIAVMAQAQREMLPEVTITCSSGNEGRCFTEGEPHHYMGPLGLPMCETTCEWTGYQTDFCAAGMPC
jgi:hypothetical protein